MEKKRTDNNFEEQYNYSTLMPRNMNKNLIDNSKMAILLHIRPNTIQYLLQGRILRPRTIIFFALPTIRRHQSFDIRFVNESQFGTPLCRYLMSVFLYTIIQRILV